MEIKSIFSPDPGNPYADIEFEPRTSTIRESDGSVVFEMTDIMVPTFWSQVATDIIAQKYMRKAGVPAVLKPIAEDGVPKWLWRHEEDAPRMQELSPEQRFTGERDSRQVFRRMAGCWTYWGWKHGYFKKEEDARSYYADMLHMLASQAGAPNSPQWFNTGLYWAYGIKGSPQGHYYVDPASGEMSVSGSSYERPQPHACFIQSVSDDLVGEGGIMDLWTKEARLFKFGSGTGTNFSGIRGEGEPLSGGGRSSGLMSFLKVGDRSAGAIKSGGTTRRAAKMVSLDLDHPEIRDFIRWKAVEEQKIASMVAGSRMCNRHLNSIIKACSGHEDEKTRYDVKRNELLRLAMSKAIESDIPKNYISRAIELAKQGYTGINFDEYDTDWEGDAYLTVSGQNSNNSIRVPNEFMRALENKGEWKLFNRTEKEQAAAQGREPIAVKSLPAEKLWEDISLSAWQCADPGVQYDTTINEWHTCPADGRINGSNPCSEYMFLDDTACNLASLNLLSFYDNKTQTLRVEHFRHACRLWTITLEISVLMAQFPSKETAQRSYDFRTLGLGFANLGSLLMVSGVPYDSEMGRAIAGAITCLMHSAAYATSAEMASELGAFPGYEKNSLHMLRVLRNHRRAAFNENPGAYEGLSVTPMGIEPLYCPQYLLEAARREAESAVVLGEKHGFRNAQVTVIAPTGTIGLVMDCDTTGVEPDYALVKFKKLAGGGYFKIINQCLPPALEKLGYSDQQITSIVDYAKGSGTLKTAPHVNWVSLQKKGFTEKVLEKIEECIPTAFEIGFCFNKYIIGEKFLKENLKFSDEQLSDPNFDILEALGFSARQMEEANRVVCGTMTIEGAPHLLEKHYSVFDCANRCGKNGRR
ncbi:MAG: adenosylcobalamin-dependent ribonucleoside-diphosphate reductase, partial [Planctomycetes bacterium]|nr:adenosylcobalamin-dependent ribonucleoside-diphosphate reductase [Planctomycetota bacterium]